MEINGRTRKTEGFGQPEIRMIALDLDGTTLDRKMRVTERTVQAIEEAAGRGVRVVDFHGPDISYASGSAAGDQRTGLCGDIQRSDHQ